MRIALISDIHANLEALRATLGAIASLRTDRIVCMGDIVGYNTDAAACVALLHQAGVLCVAGNHDRAVSGAIGTDGFSEPAKRAVDWTRRRLDDDTRAFLAGLPLKKAIDDALVAVHGALHPERGCELVRLDDDHKRSLSFAALAAHPSGARVCAFGHTHRAGVWQWCDGAIRHRGESTVALRSDALYLVNPGSVGEPRGGDSRASFMLLDTADQTIAVHRVTYDRRAALAKTRRAGLAPRFSGVPAPLRTRLIGLLQKAGVYEWLKRTLPRRAPSI